MDDKMDMATDLAFDLDEFFRQHDPQYAAQHPNPTNRRSLCRPSPGWQDRSLREMLEEMAQTGTTFSGKLPSMSARRDTIETGYLYRRGQGKAHPASRTAGRPSDRRAYPDPRGSFRLTDLSKEQMEQPVTASTISLTTDSFLLWNGTRASAVANAEMQERDNPQNGEMTVEDDYADRRADQQRPP